MRYVIVALVLGAALPAIGSAQALPAATDAPIQDTDLSRDMVRRLASRMAESSCNPLPIRHMSMSAVRHWGYRHSPCTPASSIRCTPATSSGTRLDNLHLLCGVFRVTHPARRGAIFPI
jgi:hypothetical protein